MFKRFIKGKSKGDIIFDIVVIILSIIIFLIVLYPIYFVIIASFSDSTLVSTGKVIFFPKGVSLYGYEQIFKDSRIWTGYKNTLIYSIFGTVFNLIVTLPAGYALSRKEFKARRIIMFFFTFTMFFGGGLIPTYLLMKNVGLINNPLVFIIPFALNVYNLIITRSFFESTLPSSLYEAAELDGCDHFTYFIKIALPLSKAIVSVIGLYYLVGHWNDFFTGLVYIRDAEKQPLQIVLRDILLSNQAFQQGAGSVGTGYAQKFADQIKYGVIIVSTLPVIIIYPFLQKYFDKGVMIGSIKG